MRLFIRGAWRSFSQGQHEGAVRNTNTKVTICVDQATEVGASAPSRLREKDSGTPCIPLGVISTRAFPRLKAFYLAFSDYHLIEEDENQCSIWLDDSQYITLTSEEDASQTQITHRQPQAIILHVASIESAIAFYIRMKAKEIGPVQARIDGSHLYILYEDPDGNIIKINAAVPTEKRHFKPLMSTPAFQDRPEIDLEMLLEADRWRRSKTEDCSVHPVTLRIKPEPIVGE